MAIPPHEKKQLEERRQKRGAIISKKISELRLTIEDGFFLNKWFEKLNNKEICCIHIECEKCRSTKYQAAGQDIPMNAIYELCQAHISANHANYVVKPL